MISVVKQFVDGGVTVWLRWGHEMNWRVKISYSLSHLKSWTLLILLSTFRYYTRGSDDLDPTGRRSYYDPNPQHFINAWRVVYTKFKAELPTVQHMWCANVGGMDQLWQFWPGPEYVDIVGLDYYTELNAPSSRYLYPDGLIKQTHDTFALAFDKPYWMVSFGRYSWRADRVRQLPGLCSLLTVVGQHAGRDRNENQQYYQQHPMGRDYDECIYMRFYGKLWGWAERALAVTAEIE